MSEILTKEEIESIRLTVIHSSRVIEHRFNSVLDSHELLRAELDEALAALKMMVHQHNECDYKPGHYDSGSLTSDATAMRVLAKHGLMYLDYEKGRCVRGHWPKGTANE